MHIGGFGFLNRTSSKRHWTIASWHSPHSLTWRWTLTLSRQLLWSFKPHLFAKSARNGHGGLAVGLGQFIAVRAWRDNNGWQLSAAAFWLSLNFAQQKPMWYRDLYRRERDKELSSDFASQQPVPISAPDHPTIQ